MAFTFPYRRIRLIEGLKSAKLIAVTFLVFLTSVLNPFYSQDRNTQDYWKYHERINKAEVLIGEEKFENALAAYEAIIGDYDFVFLRDYKIAAQLALQCSEKEKAYTYIRKGISAGWEIKDLKKNKFLETLKDDPEWKMMEKDYPELRESYLERIDPFMRDQVESMFKKDQWMAAGALLRIGEKAQTNYAVKKFAPHSETQILQLIPLIQDQGYPGEKLIGNDYWVSTILSHHNSISEEYARQDTLYKYIQPMLKDAIEKGEMSPYEYALIDDWFIAVSSSRTKPGYGFLNQPRQSTLEVTEGLRTKIGLRSIALRNKLVEMENKTGMNFYLPDWVKGKITVSAQ